MANDTYDWGAGVPTDAGATDLNYADTPAIAGSEPRAPYADGYTPNYAAPDIQASVDASTDAIDKWATAPNDPFGIDALTQQITNDTDTGGSLLGRAGDLASHLWGTLNNDKNKMGVNLAANMLAGMFNSKYKEGALKAQQLAAEARQRESQATAAQIQNEIAIKNQMMKNASAVPNFAPAKSGSGLIYKNLMAGRSAMT